MDMGASKKKQKTYPSSTTGGAETSSASGRALGTENSHE